MSSAVLRAAVRIPEAPARPEVPADAGRIARVVQAHHAFVWRSLRRLGVQEADVDDAVQKVFLTAARKLGDVRESQEQSFLFALAMRIASNERRADSRKRHEGIDDVDTYAIEARSPEDVSADRALLDKLLDALAPEFRSVFILFELEQMTTAEIAATLDVPVGTVASRLRRAREVVTAAMTRIEARGARGVQGGAR